MLVYQRVLPLVFFDEDLLAVFLQTSRCLQFHVFCFLPRFPCVNCSSALGLAEGPPKKGRSHPPKKIKVGKGGVWSCNFIQVPPKKVYLHKNILCFFTFYQVGKNCHPSQNSTLQQKEVRFLMRYVIGVTKTQQQNLSQVKKDGWLTFKGHSP